MYAGFWWYHGILVVHLQDSVGAFWAIKDQDTSIRGLSVENVMTDGLSRVCIWWCIMLSLITKITGIYFVGEKCKNVSAMSREWCLGDDSWHVILVLYYKMCLCAFTLQPCVMIYTVGLPWLPPAFCENQVVSESYFWFVMLNRYTGFCWFITTDSVILDYKETHEYKHQHLKKIFVSNISPSRLLTKPVTSLC